MKNAIKFYKHEVSGDVASAKDWKDDFDNMDAESWFGLPLDECEGLDWIAGGKLVQVELDEAGEWAAVETL